MKFYSIRSSRIGASSLLDDFLGGGAEAISFVIAILRQSAHHPVVKPSSFRFVHALPSRLRPISVVAHFPPYSPGILFSAVAGWEIFMAERGGGGGGVANLSTTAMKKGGENPSPVQSLSSH